MISPDESVDHSPIRGGIFVGADFFEVSLIPNSFLRRDTEAGTSDNAGYRKNISLMSIYGKTNCDRAKFAFLLRICGPGPADGGPTLGEG